MTTQIDTASCPDRASQSSGPSPENDFLRVRGRWAPTQEPSMLEKNVRDSNGTSEGVAGRRGEGPKGVGDQSKWFAPRIFIGDGQLDSGNREMACGDGALDGRQNDLPISRRETGKPSLVAS